MSDEKKSGGEKKGLPWGLPLFLLFVFIAAAFGISYLYEQKRGVEWFIDILFRMLGPVIILAIVFALLKKPKGGGADH